MKRVFLYVRVSTEEQALHGLSIEAQTAVLQEWAKTNGHQVTGLYTDAGISARKPASKRPELQRLLADVRAGKGDLIVFTKLDRWFRSIAEYYKVQEVLEQHHVDWRTIHEDYDTSTASGRLKINIMLSVAQDEADRTSERIKAVNQLKRGKLEPLTGDCPTGYKIEGKKYVKDPEKMAGVEAFFQTYLSSGSVTRSMEAAGREGVKINYHLAHKMLDSRCYYGYYFDAEGMTPPYVSREEFEKIQSMRKRVVRKTAKNRVYLFSGLVTCGECGTRMGGRVNTRQEARFYNCTAHYMKSNQCRNRVNTGEKKLEAYLLETIRGEMDRRKLEAVELASLEEPRDYPAQIEALRAKARKINDLYVNDLISLEECKTRNAACAEQIQALEREAEGKRVPDFTAAEALLSGGWEAMYQSLTPERKQEFWRILIREIRVYPDRRVEYDLNV